MNSDTAQLIALYERLSPEQKAETLRLLFANSKQELLDLVQDTKVFEALLQIAQVQSKPRTPGGLRGTVAYMAPDFDEPLEDFKDYM